MKNTGRLHLLLALAIPFTACGSHQGGRVSGDFPKYLSSIPRVGVEIENHAFLPWQKERGKDVEEELKTCLPAILDKFCGKEGCKYIYSSADPDAFRQKNLLKVDISYARSAHFRDGFSLAVTYEMTDTANLEKILKYRYKWEPETRVYFEEGMDRDEVFTQEAAETAKKFCEDLGIELENMM